MVSYSASVVTMAISQIFSIKEWPDLEIWVWGRSRSFKMTDTTTVTMCMQAPQCPCSVRKRFSREVVQGHLKWPWTTSLLNRFHTEQGHCGACRRKWRLTDTDLCPCVPRRCLTLSNPVPWMAAYLGYTLRMRTLFRGWPIMVNDTHTRRRRFKMTRFDRQRTTFYWSAIVTIAPSCTIFELFNVDVK